MRRDFYNPPRKTCPVCGREFSVDLPAEWAYQKTIARRSRSSVVLYFCSWGCMRKWEKEKEEKHERKMP